MEKEHYFPAGHVGNPEGARQRHLARSGSQSHGSNNRFILTAHRANQIMM